MGNRNTHKVGDLVTCNYENVGDGVVYRVIEVKHDYCVKIKPIFACFPDMATKKRRVREMHPDWCHRVSIDDIRGAKYELEAFLAGEMNRDPNISPMAEQARNMSKIRKTVDDGETVQCIGGEDCVCGCRDFNGRG